MGQIPQWAIGKHITSVLLTPQTVATSDGTLADTTPTRQFFGVLQEISVEASFTMENISAMDRPYENNVPIEQSSIVKFTEYEKSAGTCLAAAAAFQATYWKYVVTRGAQGFTGYGVFSSYRMEGSKPKVTAQFELKPIDVGGTAAITYG